MDKNSRGKGLAIAFLGPDGSGKSTIIDGLRQKRLPFARMDYFHLKPVVQPEGKAQRTVTDPHSKKPYGTLKSYVKLAYFVLQYNFGWYRNIRPLLQKSTLIIFDRYFDDMLADPKRYRYGGGISLLERVRKWIPKPDFYFVLIAPPEIIHARKQEVPLDELKRQIMAYDNLIDNNRYIGIDVTQGPEDIVEQIKAILLKKVYGTD